MDNILTILTIVLLVVPVIAKAIEKSLRQAGKTDAAGKMRKIIEQMEKGGSDSGPGPVFDEPFPMVAPSPGTDAGQSGAVPESVNPAAPEDVPAEDRTVTKDISRKQQTVREAVPESPAGKRRLEIDPKKLIIYSEIMKPKF